jgi:hypothetical protein
MERARQLSDINHALRDWCDAPWVQQIRVANIRDQTVILYCASASALVPFRQYSKSLLVWLNSRYRLNCTSVETKVRPPATDSHAGVYRP